MRQRAWLTIVLIGCLLAIVLFYKPHEGFVTFQQSNFSTIRLLPLEEVQNLFPDADLRTPPTNCMIVGRHAEHVFLYSQEEQNDNLAAHAERYVKSLHDTVFPLVTVPNFYMIVCISDGYGERSDYTEGTILHRLVDSYEYQGIKEIKIIGRDIQIWPIFHKHARVFAFAKRTYDTHTVAIPDFFYMQDTGHSKKLSEIAAQPIDWNTKQPRCVWRGNPINGCNQNFKNPDLSKGNQREYFVEQYKAGKFQNMDWSETQMSIQEQRKYKYILDIDGWTNTWDGTIWKLYSGSVMLKVESVWKQWYYDKLIPWKHYVPIANDFSDLNEKIEWCINHDDKCKRITEQAREFVERELEWAKVIREFAATIDQYAGR